MSRKIVLLFDGTWSNTRTRTNVTRMRESIRSIGPGDPVQPCFYYSGVGTHWYDRFTGALFGRGLSETIQQGYWDLIQNLQEGDQLYVFGYSRGAYSARSLVGLIRKCGVLKLPDAALADQAYDLYRNRSVAPDDEYATRFRAEHSREIGVRFIGVWDTVGALGIPLPHVPFNSGYYQFHDTELSKIVEHAYQVVAVDEFREDFKPTLWTKTKPQNIEVEQRWFTGSHGDIGGGVNAGSEEPLSDLTLRWLQDKAEATGLALTQKVAVGRGAELGAITDTYGNFAFGLYKWFKQRYVRRFGSGTNEAVADSVWVRFRATDYRPPTLAGHSDTPDLA